MLGEKMPAQKPPFHVQRFSVAEVLRRCALLLYVHDIIGPLTHEEMNRAINRKAKSGWVDFFVSFRRKKEPRA